LTASVARRRKEAREFRRAQVLDFEHTSYLSTLSGIDLAFYLFLTLMSILAVIATAVSCWPVR
jgi:hypothetical protein